MPPIDHRYYWPTDRPGARFPHMWQDIAWTTSTLDWFDCNFVLVCGPDAREWEAAGNEVAEDPAIPLTVRTLRALASPLSMSCTGAVLVRPDGHVAWRAPEDEPDRSGALRNALKTLLSADGAGHRTEASPLAAV